MRSILIFAAVLIGLGTIMARVADTMAPATPAHAATQSKETPSVQVATVSGRSISIPKDNLGHFQTDARIEGRTIGFMVDTGASVIALTEKDANRIGIRPFRSDFTTNVTTANGTAKAARTRIVSIDIGGVVVRDVDALVLPDNQLSQNLLGMTFLSRLKRFEYANGKLLLEQ